MGSVSAAQLLDELLGRVKKLPPEAQEQVEELLEQETGELKWVPNPGPQTEAYFSEADQLLYGGAAGGGKALDLNTPLPTPGGWTTMGEVRVGDELFDETGARCRVVAVSGVQLKRPCYRVTFSDGSELVADGSHQWLTMNLFEREYNLKRTEEWRARRRAARPSRAKANPKRTWTLPHLLRLNRDRTYNYKAASAGAVRTTEEIRATLLLRGRTNHSVMVAKSIDCEEQALAIDPYVLGLWLGDGHSKQAAITTIDQAVVSAITACGYDVAQRPSSKYGYGVRGGLLVQLRQIGVLGNKHIPPQYLRGSEAQRLALLQGLMDTDGYCDVRGQCDFTTTKRALAENVRELIVSLGIKVTIREGWAKLNGRIVSPKFTLKFLTEKPAFRLARKLIRQKRGGFRGTHDRRYVTAVEPIPSVPVRCIEVSSPSHLFLAGRTMVPTHNSQLLLGLAIQEHQRSLILRRQNNEVDDLAERAIEIVGHKDGYNGQKHRWLLPSGGLLQFGGCQHPGDEKKYKGQAKDFIGIDEASEFLESQVDFVNGWLRTSDGKQRTRLVLATNPPTSPEGEWVVRWFAPWVDEEHDLYPYPEGKLLWCERLKDGSFRFSEEPFDIQLPNGKTVRALSRTFIRSFLENNPDYDKSGEYAATLAAQPEELRRRYERGEFMAETIDDEWQVIPTAWIEAAQKRWVEMDRTRPGPPKNVPMTALGVDIAQGGADKTVLSPRYEEWFAPLIKAEGKETPDGPTAAALVTKHRRDGAQINIDLGGGWGGSCYDHLKENDTEDLFGVNPAEGSTGKTADGKLKFANKRAEIKWRLREALDPSSNHKLAIPPGATIKADLAAARWRLTSSGIRIEEKVAIKQRLGRSPDEGEAIELAWYAGLARARRSGFGGGRIKGLPRMTNGRSGPNRISRHRISRFGSKTSTPSSSDSEQG